MDRILIAIPCMDSVAAEFMASVGMLKKVGECTLAMIKGSLIYNARNDLAKQAIKGGYDYILWLDSDMQFQPDTLERLLTDAKEHDLSIVSGVYYRRVPPFRPVIFKDINPDTGKWEDLLDVPEGLFKCAGVGFGCVLTDTQVFFDVKDAHTASWFTPKWGLGEDLAFCKRAIAAGHDVWVDPAVKCGHVGHIIVNEEYYKAYREAGCDS